MSEYLFEGKTRRDAISRAIQQLDIGTRHFDIEEVRKDSWLLPWKRKVIVKVYINNGNINNGKAGMLKNIKPSDDFERNMIYFTQGIAKLIGHTVEISNIERSHRLLKLRIAAENAQFLVGRSGAYIDAIQTLANNVALRSGYTETAVQIDVEGHRNRREAHLIAMARRIGKQVQRTGKEHCLEAMRPQERCIVHREIEGVQGVATVSKGKGFYKRIVIKPDNRERENGLL